MNRKGDRKKEPGEIEIQMEDVEIILGDDVVHLDKIINHVYCAHCEVGYNSTIENYTIYLNKLDDVLFVGQCAKCKNYVARYVETGENHSKAEIARHIRTIKKEFKVIKAKKH